MPLEPSSKSYITVPDEVRGRRNSWRDKLRWTSRSREQSRNPPRREPGLDEPLKKNLVASANNGQISTAVLPGASTPSATCQANDIVHAVEKVGTVEHGVTVAVSTDLWSAAYQEAVLTFSEEVKRVILKGETIETLLTSLEQTNEELAGDSLFRRGVRRLQNPLKNFKIALDIVSPFTSIQPTAATAVGVVAIAICGAEDSLNAQIITMLEHIAIIDECDTLGQKLDDGNAIQKALVPVYKDLLSFYLAALDILTSKVFVLALVCEQLSQRLPTIVSSFLEHAALLRSRIGNATLELITDIKTLLQDNKIQKLLGVNKDKERSLLHSEIRELRAGDACKWIVADARFLKWYHAPNSERLAVFGEMGCGKTVVTAHVIEELIHLNEHQLPRPLICYHYCMNNETGKAVYIYSSLILQLLDQQEGFKLQFDQWYDNTRKSKHLDPAQSFVELGCFFSACVETLDRQLFVVIDGLDECDSESQTELVTQLDTLSQSTPRLKVYFSSRPQEGLENLLEGGTRIRWIPGRERDAIMVKYMVQRNLRELSPALRSLVADRLSELAQGSAIWVKLTIELIYKRKIKAIGPMKAFLADMKPPAALAQLYASLFAQVTGGDLDNEHLVTSALDILAVARRPLNILELGWALAMNDSHAEVRNVEELKDFVDEQRALSLLQPFISQVDLSDLKICQVRLVHQSLKELILQDVPSDWTQRQNFTDASKSGAQGARRRQPTLEADFLRLCVKYLLFDEVGQNDLFSNEQETAQVLEDLPGFGLFDDPSDSCQQVDALGTSDGSEDEQQPRQLFYDPSERGFGGLFVYASCFWLDHFKASAPELLPDTSNFVRLCEAKSKRLHNWVGQNCRPDCTITPKFVYDSDCQDPLVIASLYGPEISLKQLLQDHDIGGQEFLNDSVQQTIWQILRYGDVSRLRILFHDPRVGRQVRTLDFFRQFMKLWTDTTDAPREWACLFDLVFDISDMMIREQWANELLCVAACLGCLPVIERLFQVAAYNPDMKSELLRDTQRDCNRPDYHQSIGEAVWHNRVDVLRYLLKQDGIEVHLRHRDSGGYNVLHKAARHCNPEVMTILISHFSEGVNQVNKSGDAPLSQVVFESRSASGRTESARILLVQGGADVRGCHTDDPSSWHEPLRMAARYGDSAMCRILVEVGGADPNCVLKTGDDGCPALIDQMESEELASKTLETLCSLARMD